MKKQYFKRAIAGTAAFVMAASAAGCGSKDTAKGGVQNITWYTEVSGGGNDACGTVRRF